MTAADLFKESVEFSMTDSFFSGSVTFIYGSTRHLCVGCDIASGDNKAKADEFGLTHSLTLEVHVPKSALPRRPVSATDAVEYQGRKYTIDSIEGDDAWSPVWTVDASAPL